MATYVEVKGCLTKKNLNLQLKLQKASKNTTKATSGPVIFNFIQTANILYINKSYGSNKGSKKFSLEGKL